MASPKGESGPGGPLSSRSERFRGSEIKKGNRLQAGPKIKKGRWIATLFYFWSGLEAAKAATKAAAESAATKAAEVAAHHHEVTAAESAAEVLLTYLAALGESKE